MAFEQSIVLAFYGEQKKAGTIIRHVFGMNHINNEEYESAMHSRTIDLQRLKIFLAKHCTYSKVMQLRDLPFVQTHRDTLTRIGDGADIWSLNTHLSAFADIYRARYAALPTNTQFTERGVKESGYVSLGRRGEKNRSVLSTARARL